MEASGCRRTRRDLLAGGAALLGTGAILRPGPVSAQPATEGQWFQIHGWPAVAIHIRLHHTSRPELGEFKIVTWADDDSVFPPYRLADFSKAFVVTFQNGEPLSSWLQVYNQLAPNGRVFVAGTSQATYYLNTANTGSWSNGPRRLDPSRTAGVCVSTFRSS